ncbi:MAG: hypothetical protein AB7S26_19195 [Sandaracinaceae bacterium]
MRGFWLCAILALGCDTTGVTEPDAGSSTTDAGTAGGADAGLSMDASADDAGAASTDAGATDAGASDAGVDPGEGPGTIVAVGWREHTLAIDTDGSELYRHEQTSADPYDHGLLYRDVVYGDEGFVVVGDAQVLISPDGIAWERVTRPSVGFLSGVVFGQGRYVAANDTPAFSDDGRAWSEATNRLRGSARGIAFGDGLFVIVGDDGLTARSVDGETWTDIHMAGGGLQDIAFGDGRFVAVGHGGRRTVSVDGVTWDESDAGGDSLRAIVYARGGWLAVGDEGAFSSPTAEPGTWTAHGGPSFTGVTFGGGRFWGSAGSSIYVSDDGASWDRVVGGSSGLWDIAFRPR